MVKHDWKPRDNGFLLVNEGERPVNDDLHVREKILQGDIELYHFFPVIIILYEKGPLELSALEKDLGPTTDGRTGELKQILKELQRRDLVGKEGTRYRLNPSYIEWIKGIL